MKNLARTLIIAGLLLAGCTHGQNAAPVTVPSMGSFVEVSRLSAALVGDGDVPSGLTPRANVDPQVPTSSDCESHWLEPFFAQAHRAQVDYQDIHRSYAESLTDFGDTHVAERYVETMRTFARSCRTFRILGRVRLVQGGTLEVHVHALDAAGLTSQGVAFTGTLIATATNSGTRVAPDRASARLVVRRGSVVAVVSVTGPEADLDEALGALGLSAVARMEALPAG